jgi:60 kDa SS-A/Ro ribonucleoprotein
MHYANYGNRAQSTPQSEPIPGKIMEQNNAGGFSFSVDDMTRLQRFLILGSEGTYYVGERELTRQNLATLERLLDAGRGRDVVDAIATVSKAGRAAKNDPALFALARCSAASDVAVRQYALGRLPDVARTGTHLLHFVQYVKQFRGFGRAYKGALADWFNAKDEEALAYQLLKYQQRDGYSQRDLLRLAHPKTASETRNALYHWVVKGWPDVGPDEHPEKVLCQIWAYERAKRAANAKEVAQLIRAYRLPREAVPTEHLNAVEIWEALLEDMPLEAMMRNLATMTRVGLLKPLSDAMSTIIQRLTDQERVKRAHLHPIKILAALLTYKSGKGVRGQQTWEPVTPIVDALDKAFYASFASVEASGKRVLIAIDVSGSMHGTSVNGIAGLNCHTAAAAMAMVSARAEWKEINGIAVPQYHVIGFDTHVYQMAISPQQRLDDVVRVVASHGGGGTDCSLPFTWLGTNKVDVDAVITLSDSESWYGNSHPSQALQRYRQQVGHPVRAINIQMAATRVTNNDPGDRDALEATGFDTTTPQVISSFIRGEF